MKLAQWVGFTFGLTGALLLAMKIQTSGWAYIIFSVADVCWIIIALRKKIPGLAAMHTVYLMINSVGLYRWF